MHLEKEMYLSDLLKTGQKILEREGDMLVALFTYSSTEEGRKVGDITVISMIAPDATDMFVNDDDENKKLFGIGVRIERLEEK